MKLKQRYDVIIIWGHGIKYANEIVAMVKRNENFQFITSQYYYPTSIKKFVKKVYSCDYAPYIHLIAKTKYLMKSPKKIIYIVIKNLNCNEYWKGEGRFLHVESETLTEFKNEIRDKFNPRVNGVRTEDHVIHATDTEEQADDLLKYLRHNAGIEEFKQKQLLPVPYHINLGTNLSLQSIKACDLYAYVNDNGLKLVRIEETPQYLSLKEDKNIYSEYLEKNLYKVLCDDYSADRFIQLSQNFDYNKYMNGINYIIVKRENEKYVIQDGVHRAAILVYKGYNSITVMESE